MLSICMAGALLLCHPLGTPYVSNRYKSKADEGLSKLLSFLREEEERERLEEVERLKPIGTPVRHLVTASFLVV